MSEECKALEKKAKGIEKENPTEAIDLYKQASECFGHDENPKNKNSNLEKAAKLLRGLGKSNADPTEALDHYEDSSSIYTEIGKEGDAEKVMQEAYQKFIVAAKLISSEARKMDIADAAEQKFKLAAGYAALAGDNKLSNKCWVESADQFYQDAKELENPREAFEVFKHAILNYKKGKADEKFDLLLTNAAEKFTKRGLEILKTKKTLVLAIGNFVQAENIYRFITSDQKSQESDLKIQEICERIGMVKDSTIHYLESQGITAVSFSDLPSPSHQPDKEELSVLMSDVEPSVQDITIDEEPLSSIPEPIPEIQQQTESEISTPEISLPTPKLPTDDEVEIEVEAIIETSIDELDLGKKSPTPDTPDVISEIEGSSDPRPVKHGIPGPTVKIEVDKPVEELRTETPVEEIETVETNQTPVTPEVISEKEERFDPRPIKHGIPGPTAKLEVDDPKDELPIESPPEVIDEFLDLLEPEVVENEISDPLPEIVMDELKEEVETQLEEMDEPKMPQPIEIMDQGVVTPIEEKYQPDVVKEEIAESPPISEPVGIEDEVKFESIPTTVEVDQPEMEQQRDIPPQEVVSDIEEKFVPEMIKEEITEFLPKFDTVEVEDDEKVGSLPAMPMGEIEKSVIEPSPIESTSEVDDYMKSRFDPDAIEGENEGKSPSIDMRSRDDDIATVTGDIAKLSEPIIKILREQGYVTEDTSPAELLQVPEYQILLFIINNHPVPLEEIEEKTDVSSISLALSNLQADGLVEQTNDYQWTVSKKIKAP